MAGIKDGVSKIYAIFLLLMFPFFVLPNARCQTGSQDEDNPFELNHRLEKPVEKKQETTEELSIQSGNPFDIKRRSEFDTKPPPPKNTTPTGKETRISAPKAGSAKKKGGFKFWLVIGLVGLTTLIITLFRGAIAKSYNAFTNDNVLRLLHREQKSFSSWPMILYGFFLFNIGVFIYLIIQHFSTTSFPYSNFQLLLFSIIGAATVYFSKHILLSLLAQVFPVEKEVKLYNFTIVIFNIVIGVLLVPFNLFIILNSFGISKTLIFIALAFIALAYLYRSLRGIFIASKFLTFNKFHFFIYLCTVEIAPLLVIGKLVLDQVS